ncbi:hypothetical protein HN371_00450 [Candidatus Poribacteria bacterium]|jgi:hypothetical protein|nr:hypothetical protein [Candidatus Poribacteria bacterium]MBT7101161.1 hypothetical protein [Candidatus Poribacteria bacterium]
MPTDDYDDDPLDSGPGPEAEAERKRRRNSGLLKILRQSVQYQAEMKADVREMRRCVDSMSGEVDALTKATESYKRTLDSMRDSCAVASMPVETPTPTPSEPVAKTVTAQVALLVAKQLPWAALLAVACVGGLLLYGKISGHL